MANDNNIKNFTAADIEKYHKAQLSAKDRHDLEKAALDDPFLADALEGYAMTGTDVNADIAELKKRLAEKTEQGKVIPLPIAGRSSFPWLRAAVVVVLIAGAGTLAYQFLFTKNEGPIAELSKQENIAKSNDSVNKEAPLTTPGNHWTNAADSINQKPGSQTEIANQDHIVLNDKDGSSILKDSTTYSLGTTLTNSSAPTTSIPIEKLEAKAEYKKTDVLQQQAAAERKADVALKNESNNILLNKPAFKDTSTESIGDVYYRAKTANPVNGIMSKRGAENNYYYTNPTLFRGRVTDASNNALPFANITNRQDNVGTYSDAQGYFTLVSPDSVLNVQIRSVGFENNNVQLRGLGAGYNPVIMQEDRSLSAQVLDTVKRNFRRVAGNTMTFEEPEPEDGWGAYRSYVMNNLNIPEKFDMKKSGETAENTVEVSFEVNKNGEPVNIKVEKSLCDQCDREAVRLIKDGPKWKRKTKKGKRTTVTVPFVKP